VALGDDFDGAVGHFDGGLIVDRIRRIWDPGRPSFCLGHGIARQAPVIHQMRTDREINDSQCSVATCGRLPADEVLPTQGVITMLPALNPTQTVSRRDGKRSASRDCRIQWHRYKASPPFTSRTSVSWTKGTQRSSSMLGSAASSRTPKDFQPSSHIGFR
jgi:hypothetical protein